MATRRLPSSARAREDAAGAALAVGLTFAIAMLHRVVNPRFFYWDDMQHAIMPVARTIGDRLLVGDWPTITLLSWQSGNLLGEGQYQLFNPVSLILFTIIASVEDLSIGATIYSVTYMLIAASGAYFLARRVGAPALAAAAAGLAYATSPFLLYWLAGSWTNGLASMAFLPWALGLLASQRITVPVATGLVITSYLMAVSGWIHGLFSLMVFAAFAIGSQRGSWSLGEIMVVAASMASGVLLAGPQLIATLDAVAVGTRVSGVSSSGVLTLDPQSLLAGAMLPPYFGRLNWGSPEAWLAGGSIPMPPIAYCAWFLAPAIAIAMSRGSIGRSATWLLWGALGLGVLMLGPEQIGPMRWPVRFLPAFCLGVCVWASTQLSDLHDQRKAIKWCLGIIAAGGFMAWQQAPQYWLEISAWILALGVASTAILLPIRVSASSNTRVPPLLLTLGFTAAVSAGFAFFWPSNLNLPDWNTPSQARLVEIGDLAPYSSTLQVYAYTVEGRLPSPEEMKRIPSGNVAMHAGQRLVNGYSPIGPRGLSRALCSSSFGWTCDLLMPRLTRDVTETGLDLLDLMRVDTIKVQPQFQLSRKWLSDSGDWRLAKQSEGLEEFERLNKRSVPGTLSFLDENVHHEETVEVEDEAEVHVLRTMAPAKRNLVVFARAWYPGYVAKWNDQPIDVFAFEDIFVAVRLPEAAGEGTLELRHSALANPLSVLSLIAGVLMLAASILAARLFGQA